MTTMSLTYELHKLIEKGFPHSTIDRSVIDGDLTCEIDLTVNIDSHGSSGNGWDDPGEACEYHIHSIGTTPDEGSIMPLSQEQKDWLESFINNDVQEWDANSSNWYDPADDDYF